MAFEIASTNLVIEFGVILALLMGWQFTLAEFTGGPIMIAVVAVLFRLTLRERLLRDARVQADRGIAGSMEGHPARWPRPGTSSSWSSASGPDPRPGPGQDPRPGRVLGLHQLA